MKPNKTSRKPSRRESEEMVRRAEEALRLRTREMNCLFAVFEVMNRPGIGLDERLAQVPALLPQGWQYPDIAYGRVVFEDSEYFSEGFRPSPWRQAADIVIHGEGKGAIEVHYGEERREEYEGPFLKEERGLINAIAVRISRFIERMRLRLALQASEEKYHTIFETTGTATILVQEDMQISLANREFEKLSGFSKEEVEGKKSWLDFLEKGDVERIMDYHQTNMTDTDSAPRNCTFRLVNRDHGRRDVLATIARIPKTKTSVASFMDITDFKRAREEREELHRRLEEALTKVLSGFLPICAHCKKVRDQYGRWNQIEAYIRDRSNATFTHGICPDCGKKLYAELWVED